MSMFHDSRAERLAQLLEQLLAGTFQPEPAALITIPKPRKPGETRPISLLRVEDKIVLTALHHVLEPLFERQFPDGSFAYRRQRGVAPCARAVEQHLRAGFRQVGGADIARFFDCISRPRLLAQVREALWERPILQLLERFLTTGAVRRRQGLPEWVDDGRGVAQGSPLSPLLANVYLLPLDRFLDSGAGTSGELRWVRYADNILL